MRFTNSINASKCQEWGINLAQGALVDLINQASSWAKPHVVNGEVFFWVSRNKIIDEIPVAYSKPDTVYRSLKILADKGIINHVKEGKKDLINLTEIGKSWNVKGTDISNTKLGNKSDIDINSEISPTLLGNESEKEANNSEIDPTNKNTNYKSTTYKKIEDISLSDRKCYSEKPAIKPAPKSKFDPANYPLNNFAFISVEAWKGYHKMRAAKKKIATERACEIVLNKLADFNASGLDANLALDNATNNCWTDVYEPKPATSTTNKKGITNANNQSSSQPSQLSSTQFIAQQRANAKSNNALRTVS